VWESAGVRLRLLAVTVAGAALGVGSLTVVRAEPGGSLGGGSITANIALLAAGWALIWTGVATWARRPSSRFGRLLAAAGFAWFLAELDNPGVGSGAVFTIGLVAFAASAPLVAHAALAYPDGRVRTRTERAVLAVAYASAIGVLGVASALVFDPVRQGCSECPVNHLAVTGDPGLLNALQRCGVWLGLAWATALAAMAAGRVVRSSRAARLLTGPVLLPAVAYLAFVAVDHAHSVRRGFLSNDLLDARLWAGQAAALVAMAAGVVLAWVRARRARAAMARLVVELDAAPAPGGLRDALARALADPDLEIAYPVGDGRHVDRVGRPIDLQRAGSRAATPLVRGGREVAVLLHAPELLDNPGLIEEVGTAARLALDHEHLQAELRAQLETLRASRARTVQAGDAERQRLERDLHDGAQQRLVVLSLAIQLVRNSVGANGAARADAAESEVQAALEDLREIGRGIYPAVLVDEGLAAAVDSLAEDGDVSISIRAMPVERFAAPVEAAAYFLIAEIVKRTGAGSLTVCGELSGGRLVVEVNGTGELDDDLVQLEDRIGALDGVLTVRRKAGNGVAVRAEVPCAS
jgi:signal transduction histidine kinase